MLLHSLSRLFGRLLSLERENVQRELNIAQFFMSARRHNKMKFPPQQLGPRNNSIQEIKGGNNTQICLLQVIEDVRLTCCFFFVHNFWYIGVDAQLGDVRQHRAPLVHLHSVDLLVARLPSGAPRRDGAFEILFLFFFCFFGCVFPLRLCFRRAKSPHSPFCSCMSVQNDH